MTAASLDCDLRGIQKEGELNVILSRCSKFICRAHCGRVQKFTLEATLDETNETKAEENRIV